MCSESWRAILNGVWLPLHPLGTEHRCWGKEEGHTLGPDPGGWVEEPGRSASPKWYFLKDVVHVKGNPAHQPLSTTWPAPFPERSEPYYLIVKTESNSVSIVVPGPHTSGLHSLQRAGLHSGEPDVPSILVSLLLLFSVSQPPITTPPPYQYSWSNLPGSYIVRSRESIFLSTLPWLFSSRVIAVSFL